MVSPAWCGSADACRRDSLDTGAIGRFDATASVIHRHADARGDIALHSLGLRSTFHARPSLVHSKFRDIHSKSSIRSSFELHTTFTRFSLDLHSTFIRSSHELHSILTPHSLNYLHDLHSTFIRHAHYLYIHSFDFQMTFILFSHDLHSTFIRHSHYLYTFT